MSPNNLAQFLPVTAKKDPLLGRKAETSAGMNPNFVSVRRTEESKGQMSASLAARRPTPPPQTRPPTLCGTTEGVVERFKKWQKRFDGVHLSGEK